MQFLLFSIGNDRYGLHTARVVRVLPRLALKEIPHAPGWVAGLMNYHGNPVPVIDLSMLAKGTPASDHFDTRIVLVDYCSEARGERLLGLLAEQAGDLCHAAPEEFAEPGVDNRNAPYLGQVATSGGAIMQLVDVDRLLPPEVRDLLFQGDHSLP